MFRSLGLLNCIRIWHDNTGQGSSSSWFLKYIIIRDLQTMEKSHFICQRWFAVEKEDEKVRCNYFISNFSLLLFENRLNVFYLQLVKLKNVNFPMYYPNKPIIVYLMVIFGFQSFLVHHQINLHVSNDVHVVLFYYFFPCF